MRGLARAEGALPGVQVVYKWGTILTLILIPIWPLLTLPAGVFPKVKAPKKSA